MRAAIYARMSTDKQSTDSPADQIARSRAFAESRGWTVAEALVVTEAGVSGASRHNRPGLLELVARIDEWDVLLCWDSSRLARDSEDLGWIRNRLRAHRRTGYEVSTGLDLFNVGAKVLGVMAEEYLVKLRADTQRGLRGRAERGLSTGGTPYGYRSEPVAVDEHGRPVEGAGFRVLVDDDAAPVVRRIFERFAGGASYRGLAIGLNRDGIASPRRKGWSPYAIHELVRNPIYRGERIFNRSEWIKDHETGRRRRYERPPSEWVRQADESLRIVPEELWERAQARTGERGRAYRRSPDGRRLRGVVAGAGHRVRRKYLLAGLLQCGACGGAFYGVKSRNRLCCGWRIDRGPTVCASGLVVPRLALEDRVLTAIRDRVFDPEAVAEAVEIALGIVRERLGGDDGEADRRRLAQLDVETENVARLAAKVGEVAGVARVIEGLEAERRELLARMTARQTPRKLDEDAIRRVAERWAADARATLESASEAIRRDYFEGLLGGRRMEVHEDAEQGFRVEGIFEVPWMQDAPLEPRDSQGGIRSSGGGI